VIFVSKLGANPQQFLDKIDRSSDLERWQPTGLRVSTTFPMESVSIASSPLDVIPNAHRFDDGVLNLCPKPALAALSQFIIL
jgi:hypothetical protein